MAKPVHIVWLKRDLRIDDHAPLAEAAAQGPVLPLFIVEPSVWLSPDASGRHFAFVTECIAELRHGFASLGQPLIIRVGESVDVLDAIAKQTTIAALWSHQETGNAATFARDRAVTAWCRANGIAWHERRQHGITRRLGDRNGWARDWDRLMAEPVRDAPRALSPIANIEARGMPTASELGLAPDPCPGRQRGGREIGLETLYTFLHHRGRDYRRQMSSPVTAFEACSRISTYLAWGTLSMREVAQATYQRLRELRDDPHPDATTRAFRASLISFAGRLHWHCHFMQKLETEPRIEFEDMHRAYSGLRPNEPDAARFKAWCAGETGFPFVDACMRALNQTGWINFRMRAMLMSFASYQLWLPWRPTGLHLARVFTDYEPGIHWPQVQMQSGTTGINTLRIYNPVKQSLDQDKAGAFIRQWVPELAGVPDAFIHEPWRWDGASERIGKIYPERIVDHLQAARVARDQLWGVRKTRIAATEANAIQDKHGSRKSGIPMTGQRQRKATASKRNKQAVPADQLKLDI